MDDSWWGFFQRLLPEYNVHVTLIAWFDGIKVSPPDDNILEIMLHKKEPTKSELSVCLQVGNVYIFDFLVDGMNCKYT